MQRRVFFQDSSSESIRPGTHVRVDIGQVVVFHHHLFSDFRYGFGDSPIRETPLLVLNDGTATTDAGYNESDVTEDCERIRG